MAESPPHGAAHDEPAPNTVLDESANGAAATNDNAFAAQSPPLTDDAKNGSDSASDLRFSWYDEQRRSGSDWQFGTQIRYITGDDSQRLRTEMAAVIRELLTWAAGAQADDQSR